MLPSALKALREIGYCSYRFPKLSFSLNILLEKRLEEALWQEKVQDFN